MPKPSIAVLPFRDGSPNADQAAFCEGVANDVPLAPLLDQVRQAARGGLEASRPLLATKGRASFLGERSIGHLDPGAQSSYLLVDAVCNVIEKGVTQ